MVEKTKTKKEKANVAKAVNNDITTNKGKVKLRGRSFKGTVISKHEKRIAIEFERTVYIKKYERYANKKTKLHARLPDSMTEDINIGDYVEIRECRPLSKIIHFVVVKKITGEKE